MRTRLIGIDGAGGSGQSTLTATLSDKIVSTDDFVTGPWEWFDLERLRREVIEPLLRGEPARLEAWSEKEQRYWEEQRPRDAADVVVDGSG